MVLDPLRKKSDSFFAPMNAKFPRSLVLVSCVVKHLAPTRTLVPPLSSCLAWSNILHQLGLLCTCVAATSVPFSTFACVR